MQDQACIRAQLHQGKGESVGRRPHGGHAPHGAAPDLPCQGGGSQRSRSGRLQAVRSMLALLINKLGLPGGMLGLG